MLANGQGGLDWSGLPYALALFGVREVEPLLHRLIVIKTWKPRKD
jgi:hypothetical protein